MTLGEYINNYLIEHDMSIREFARLADISHTYLPQSPNRKTGKPSPAFLISLALAFCHWLFAFPPTAKYSRYRQKSSVTGKAKAKKNPYKHEKSAQKWALFRDWYG